MQQWNWGIPVAISEPPGAGAQPLGWDILKFNQIGLFDLRRRIGVFASEPGVYNTHRAKFDAADLAWFAAGLSSEVLHLTQNAFLPEFNALRQGMPSGQASTQARSAIRTRIQKLTFDLAALWDRTFGGATLILHVEGTMRPNAPRLPEYIKSDVYFPGYLIQEDPRFSPIISDLVQTYLVDVGMPVIERWERCARSIWPMTQGEGGRVPLPYPTQPIQPNTIPQGSSTFVYHGHLLATPSNVVFVDEYDDGDEELSASMLETVTALEQRDLYRIQVESVQSALSTTEQALTESLAREQELRSELDSARALLMACLDGTEPNVNVNRRRGGSASRHASPAPRIVQQTSPTPHTAHHGSPISHVVSPTFHDRFDHFSSTPAMSTSRHANTPTATSRASPIARRLFGNTVGPASRSEGLSDSDGVASTPPGIGPLAEYYNFLNVNKMSHLRATLDVICHSLPISLWAAQLENAGVPLTLIDSVMVLMVAAKA